MLKYLCFVLLLGHAFAVAAADRDHEALSQQTYREWVSAMKVAARGPFDQVRWFCKDGEILPPEPFACVEHGGGTQHGQWSQRTTILRQQGYLIANVMADLPETIHAMTPANSEALNQILLEQFLINIDDGWIMRQARYYRGAFQAEAEANGARALLTRMLEQAQWYQAGFGLLRMAAQLLPHGVDTASAREIRQLSSDLAGRDEGFVALRNRIHIRPSAADAESVTEYLEKVQEASLRADYQRLAKLITEVYQSRDISDLLRRFAGRIQVPSAVANRLRAAATQLEYSDPALRFQATAQAMRDLRDGLPRIADGIYRLRALDLSLQLEREHFVAASLLRTSLPRMQRLEWIRLLASSAQAIYGSGLISARLLTQVEDAAASLAVQQLTIGSYRDRLDLLARMPDWANQQLNFRFAASMQKLQEIEPLAALFIQDQLRGSPLFFYAEVLQLALTDANQQLGVSSWLFGLEQAQGMRALNPGLARGRLVDGDSSPHPPADAILLVSETVSHLPPVAGILTAGSGNPLSHVQLLARSLGIPNVAIASELLTGLRSHVGQEVQLAVSPAGSVEIARYEQTAAAAAPQESREQGLITADLGKLRLEEVSLVALSDLRASDSGVRVGPKAARLGELYHHFPEHVADGLVIPFGVFRQLLAQPMPGTQGSVFDWMEAEYSRLASLPVKSSEREQQTQQFRQRLQDWILNADPGQQFYQQLEAAAQRVFGEDGSYGVFVRSDTNVEDLPGFTGAGLNLTVPHVVGMENIKQAISRVWASPFSERAFRWRQAQMSEPQHVYPAVLLMRSVPADRSGVMVTRDIQSGASDWLSVATNLGVGGAVDGQSAESLRVHLDSGQVEILSDASAGYQRVLRAQGGVEKQPLGSVQSVLTAEEISQLLSLARVLPERFPAILDAQGMEAAADVEFGFVAGRLALFQIRPVVESQAARDNAYLQSMDKGLNQARQQVIRLDESPQ